MGLSIMSAVGVCRGNHVSPARLLRVLGEGRLIQVVHITYTHEQLEKSPPSRRLMSIRFMDGASL